MGYPLPHRKSMMKTSLPEIAVCRDVQEVSQRAAQEFVRFSQKASSSTSRFHVPLSGGSVRQALYIISSVNIAVLRLSSWRRGQTSSLLSFPRKRESRCSTSPLDACLRRHDTGGTQPGIAVVMPAVVSLSSRRWGRVSMIIKKDGSPLITCGDDWTRMSRPRKDLPTCASQEFV